MVTDRDAAPDRPPATDSHKPSEGRSGSGNGLCTGGVLLRYLSRVAGSMTQRDDVKWRKHQAEALDAIASADGPHYWVVLPPGAGKTMLGAGAARRFGRRTVAFAPNVAITRQWVSVWEELTGEPAGHDRTLPTGFTALTYQSLAVFDAEADDEDSHISRLHPNGRALIEQLRAAGPLTIILDECHHLLQVWGNLLAEVLEILDDAIVVALTATPPELLSPSEATLVERLFGRITYSATIPAVVVAGDLVPFAELAWFTTPTRREVEWLEHRRTRSLELITELTRVDVSTPLRTWAAGRNINRTSEEFAAAELRLALAGDLEMPPVGHVTERHRRDPDLEDWLEVAGRWLLDLRAGQLDNAYVDHVASLLPGVGFRLTRHGIRPGVPLVDRVLSRSVSKARAAGEIVARTLTEDPDARLLVLTDHVTATAIPADLRGVLEPESGSARWVLATLLRDERIAPFEPAMVTGSLFGGSEAFARRLAPEGTNVVDEGDGIFRVDGWSSSEWVGQASRALAEGTTRCLVGTRALLGEGWDARCVTGVVDLTTATTSTAIVQTRGRSLRTDPAHPDKVAVNWTVTCLAHQQPQGDADYRRLVRKHDGWFAVDQEGEVTDGVAHLDSRLGVAGMPAGAMLEVLNADAIGRSQDHRAIRAAWETVDPDRVAPIHTLRIRPSRTLTEITGPDDLPVPLQREAEPTLWSGPVLVRSAVGVAGLLGAALWPAFWWLFTLVVLVVGADLWRVAARQRRASRLPGVREYARAVAHALHAKGLISDGAGAVVVHGTEAGEIRVRLEGVDEDGTALFTEALAEVMGMIEQPRYLISREVPTPADGLRGVVGPQEHHEVWHQVPTVMSRSRADADLFTEAWNQHVGAGRSVFMTSYEAHGLLRALRFTSPLGEGAGVNMVQRRRW